MFYTQFGVVFGPLIVLLVLILYFLNQTQVQSIRVSISDEDYHRIRMAKELISKELQSVSEDALYLASLQSLSRWLENPLPENKAIFESDMLLYMGRYPFYEQVRYIDSAGMEVVRVDLVEGQAKLLPEHQLQDKSARYYVKAIHAIPPGKVYLSPLDLNVENGVVEAPWKPTLRIGMSIYHDGEYRGMIVLNHLGETLLTSLRALNESDQRVVWLLNEQGYWLIGPESEKEWRFMWPDQPQFRFYDAYPTVWRALNAFSGDSPPAAKQSNLREGIFTYVPVDTSSEGGYANNQRWYLVTHTSPSFVAEQAAAVTHPIVVFFVINSVLIFVISLLIARLKLEGVDSRRLLSESERQYLNLLEGSPDAIVVVDHQGCICLVNAQLEKTFGYTRQELIGQPVEQLMPLRFRKQHVHDRDHFLEKPVFREMGSLN